MGGGSGAGCEGGVWYTHARFLHFTTIYPTNCTRSLTEEGVDGAHVFMYYLLYSVVFIAIAPLSHRRRGSGMTFVKAEWLVGSLKRFWTILSGGAMAEARGAHIVAPGRSEKQGQFHNHEEMTIIYLKKCLAGRYAHGQAVVQTLSRVLETFRLRETSADFTR